MSSYAVGVVPTYRKKKSWQESVTNEIDYDLLASSGMLWVWFPDIPLTWAGCLEELNKEKELDSKC